MLPAQEISLHEPTIKSYERQKDNFFLLHQVCFSTHGRLSTKFSN